MKVTITSDLQTLVKFWLVPLGIGIAGYAIYSARTAFMILGTAFFLALVLNLPVSKLAKILPGRSRIGGTAIAFIAVVSILVSVVTLVIPPIVQQTVKFIDTAPALVTTLSEQYSGVDEIVQKYDLQPQVDEAIDRFRSNISGWVTNAGVTILGSLSSIISFIIAIFLTLVLTFLMLIEGPTLLRKLWRLYKDDEKLMHHREVVNRMYHVVNGYVIGQLTIAGIGSFMTALIVFILSAVFGVPGNLAIPAAAIYFIFTLIPMFGSVIAAGVIGLMLLLNSPFAALIFVITYTVYQQIENNIIGPLVQSRTLNLTALWILSAVTIGIYVFGIVGAIISIPIAGCLKVLFDDYLGVQPETRKVRKPRILFARAAKK